jgi:hypothetical protein
VPHIINITLLYNANVEKGCRLGTRQQINQATSYLDLSPLYGSSEETSKLLRSAKGGLLNTQRRNLPMASHDSRSCRLQSRTFPCFFSGDSRINEHPGLALMHLLFLRSVTIFIPCHFVLCSCVGLSFQTETSFFS